MDRTYYCPSTTVSLPAEPQTSVQVLCQNGWERLGLTWRDQPIFVDRNSGEMAYEADSSRLVLLPDHVQEAIVDTQLWQWTLDNASPEARNALTELMAARAN